MSISVTGKLNKPANQFAAGDRTGFGVRVGVQFYNRETKAKEWTNYEAVVFAGEGRQRDFYASTLVEGSVIELNGSGCQIKTYNDQHSIAILEARLGFIHTAEQPAFQPQQQAPRVSAPPPPDPDFEFNDIPF